jgi:hypothetical protein
MVFAPTVYNVWGGPNNGLEADVLRDLRGALQSLPNYLIRSVEATVRAPAPSRPNEAVYSITFPQGETELDTSRPLSCFFGSTGTLGCPAKGCRPKAPQLRALATEPVILPDTVVVNSSAVLVQPPALVPSDENSANVWGVQTTLILRAYSAATLASLSNPVSPALGDPLPRITYAWEGTSIYGRPAASMPTTEQGLEAALYALETPLPPAGINGFRPVQGPFGLYVDLESRLEIIADLFTGSITPQSYVFKWALPTCTARVVQPLPVSLEKIECGGRGSCDRSSGQCECFNGYNGQACDVKEASI